VVELLYRPAFLQALDILLNGEEGARSDDDPSMEGAAPVEGSFSFSTNSPDALVSAAALAVKLSGAGEPPEVEASGSGFVLRSGGVLVSCMPSSGGEAAWTGGGEIGNGMTALRVEIGETDRLFVLSSDGKNWERRFLPEGAGRRYAELDGLECGREGRASRILDDRTREAAEAAGRGGA